jgi:hypothetical protein
MVVSWVRKRAGVAGLVAVVAALVAAGVWIAASDTGRAAAKVAAREALVVNADQLQAGCARNQVIRGYLILRAGDPDADGVTTTLAPDLFRIVWCERSFAIDYKGPPVFLPADGQRCFLALERRGFWNHRDPFTDRQELLKACQRLN